MVSQMRDPFKELIAIILPDGPPEKSTLSEEEIGPHDLIDNGGVGSL